MLDVIFFDPGFGVSVNAIAYAAGAAAGAAHENQRFEYLWMIQP